MCGKTKKNKRRRRTKGIMGSTEHHHTIVGTMTPLFHIFLTWIFLYGVPVSARLQISVSGAVGSTAVLPCELWSVFFQIPYVRWLIESETVFERVGEETYEGEGYEGRVDVPKEELNKRNCSLVLRNLTLTDSGIYTSHQKVMRTKRSPVRTVSRVNLSVSESTERPKTTPLSDTARVNRLHPLVLVASLLSCLRFSRKRKIITAGGVDFRFKPTLSSLTGHLRNNTAIQQNI